MGILSCDIVSVYLPPIRICPNFIFLPKFGFCQWTPYLFARCHKICSFLFLKASLNTRMTNTEHNVDFMQRIINELMLSFVNIDTQHCFHLVFSIHKRIVHKTHPWPIEAFISHTQPQTQCYNILSVGGFTLGWMDFQKCI